MTEPTAFAPSSDKQPCAAERGPTVPAPPDPDAPPEFPCLALAEAGTRSKPEVGTDTLRRIYLDVALPHLRAEPPRGAVYRLFGAIGRTYSWVDVPVAGGDGYAVLGSHRRCDLVLADDFDIGYRHLAAVLVRLFEDDPDSRVLRLIDLRTGVPIFVHDDRPRSSVDAPFAVRVGHHVICGLPATPGAAANDAGAVAAAGDDLRAFQAHGPQSPPSSLVDASPSHIRLTVQREGLGASVELPTQALDDGIIIGRALNCFDGGLRRVLDDSAISGTHLLLLRDWDEILGFDLCATNGTRVAGQRVRRHRFTDDEPAVELGKRVTLSITSLKG